MTIINIQFNIKLNQYESRVSHWIINQKLIITNT